MISFQSYRWLDSLQGNQLSTTSSSLFLKAKILNKKSLRGISHFNIKLFCLFAHYPCHHYLSHELPQLRPVLPGPLAQVLLHMDVGALQHSGLHQDCCRLEHCGHGFFMNGRSGRVLYRGILSLTNWVPTFLSTSSRSLKLSNVTSTGRVPRTSGPTRYTFCLWRHAYKWYCAEGYNNALRSMVKVELTKIVQYQKSIILLLKIPV